MRRGALPRATIVGAIFVVSGCGSQNPPPKVVEGPASSSSAATAGSAADAPSESIAQQGVEGFPDPSKLLESYEGDRHTAPPDPAKPSKSGLVLEVLERGPGQPWLVHIVNRGDQPAELAADTRLLWFDVKLPGKKKPSVCKLPEPLAPGAQPEPRLIVHLEPDEGVADQFDPRLYCFTEGAQKVLVPGAEITPHFGWPEAPPKKRWKKGKLVEEPALQKPPFVARQSLEAESRSQKPPMGVSPKAAARLTSAGITGADKYLEAPTLTLQSEYAEWARPDTLLPPPAESDDQPPPPLAFRVVQGSDAKAEHEATVQLTISNQSPLPTYVYFRREMVTFEVVGPVGVMHCPGRLYDRTPERSSFLHLTRKASRTYAVRLAELCPRGTFASPGLYLVYARFDAAMNGQEQGIEAFVGPVQSRTPATVRIRTGEQAIFQKRPMLRTPASEPAAASTDRGTP